MVGTTGTHHRFARRGGLSRETWHRRRTAASQSCPRRARSGKAPCKQSRQTGPWYRVWLRKETIWRDVRDQDQAASLDGVQLCSPISRPHSYAQRSRSRNFRTESRGVAVDTGRSPGPVSRRHARESCGLRGRLACLTTRRHLLQSPSKIESRGCLAVPADVAVGHRPLLYLSRFEHRLAERGAR